MERISAASRETRGAVLVSRALFAVAIAGSALAIGTLHAKVLCFVVGALAIAMLFAWFGGEPVRARRPATMLLAACLLLCGFTALQAVPMPSGWLASVAPSNADVWARALTPLQEAGPASVSLSLDPIATRVNVLRGVAYLVAFLAALRLANRRNGVLFIESAIVVTAALLAITAMLHPAFGAQRVFGIYEHGPGISPRHIAPLLNPNHLAAYLNVGYCLALAAAISPRPEVPRLVSFAIVGVLGAVQLWVASRGGVLAMAMGTLLVIAMSRAALVARVGLLSAVSFAVVVAAGIGMSVLASSEESWNELASVESSKLQLFRNAMTMVPSFALFGAGRGAFQSTFPAFREGTGFGDYTHPENVIAQWCTEWGLPVSIVAAGLVVIALRPGVALARTRPAVGAWAALAVVAVHNLVDFSSEVPAVMIAMSACAGICVAGNAQEARRWRFESWGARPTVLAVTTAAAAVAAIVWAVPCVGRDVDDERDALRVAALDTGVSRDQFHADVRAAMLRHPAEPYLPFAGALRAARARDESVVPWIERTFERARVYGPAHFLLARALSRRSRAQARMEYRFAVEQDSLLWAAVLPEATRLVDGFDDAMEIIPEGPSRAAMLEGLAKAVAERLPATQVRLDEQILKLNPRALEPLGRRAEAAVRDIESGDEAPWCVQHRPPCISAAEEAAKRVIDVDDTRCAGFELRARVLAAAGDMPRALDTLQQAADRVNDRQRCVEQLFALAVRADDERRQDLAISKLEHMGCATEKECRDNLLEVARFEVQRGNKRRALALYQKILERDPDDDFVLQNVAQLATELGMHVEAVQAYRRLAAKHPENPGWQRALATEQEASYGTGLNR